MKDKKQTSKEKKIFSIRKEKDTKKNMKKKKKMNISLKRKKKDNSFNNFKTTEVIFLLVITCIISLIMGILIEGNRNKTDLEVIKDEALNEFIENYEYVVENYYSDVDKEKLLSGAINGMMSSLEDEYSTFLEQESSNTFNVRLEGSYEGIGVEIYNDYEGNIVVLSVLENSPAEEAGIQPNDILKSIDDQSLENTATTDLTNYIKQNAKESYVLNVLRGEETLTFTLKRKQITIQSVSTKTFLKNDKKVGYLYISIFSNNTADQFKTAIESLEEENIDSLIIDVRENSGGHLTAAVDMLSILLDSSKIIYQIEQKGDITKYYSEGNVTKDYPIVVLQNSGSASASELLSAALKESYGAKVVGETSYGKGTVQELVQLSNGDSYKFTTKKWLTPDGNWIHEKGVTPDVVVSLDENYANNPSDETDTQLQKALEIITAD